jgi:predicted O-linked N-acetylglucosamine transferase (SPINDLY family)
VAAGSNRYSFAWTHGWLHKYMEAIRHCDLFLNPFPFGNTNGVVDTVSAGLVGVCRTGREVHEHIDQGLFGRLGLPGWMVANSTEEYVAAAVRLVDDEDERLRLRRELIAQQSVSRLFAGRPEIFGERVLALLGARVPA